MGSVANDTDLLINFIAFLASIQASLIAGTSSLK